MTEAWTVPQVERTEPGLILGERPALEAWLDFYRDTLLHRVPEPGHYLRLDLPDALAGDAVDLADLVQRLGLAVGQPEPHRDHAGLALGRVSRTLCSCSCSSVNDTASPGWITSESWIRSPNSLSSSSPSGAGPKYDLVL
jgi:hypothetical protein